VRDVAAGEVARLRGCRLPDADGRGGGNRAIDIVASDAPVAAGALDARGVDVVLEQGAANGGAEA
jgi:hypothetical protein